MWVWGWAVLCPDSESTIKDNLPTNLVRSARMGVYPHRAVFLLICADTTFPLLIIIMVSRYYIVRHSICFVSFDNNYTNIISFLLEKYVKKKWQNKVIFLKLLLL